MIDSMVRSPSTLRFPVRLTECTVTVEPSVLVVARADIEPKVATAGTSTAGVLARAVEVPSPTSTWALSPGAGLESATGSPRPEVAATRNG